MDKLLVTQPPENSLDIPIAEDCFGDQYLLRDSRVLYLSGVTERLVLTKTTPSAEYITSFLVRTSMLLSSIDERLIQRAQRDRRMRQGFTRRPKALEPVPPDQGKNYITPGGIERLKEERHFLLTKDRPAVVQVVAWAASNGDRSENADYQYSKRRLRQIDGRVRFLTQRIEAAEVIDPEAPRTGQRATRVFFGATVRYENAAGSEREVSIVGTDEVSRGALPRTT